MKRKGRYYSKNEKEVMKQLGFKPTIASGSGWLEKEDGISENCIAQLKSTDASSIRINLLDIQKLEHNALVSKKNPVFVVQFLKDNSVYLLLKLEEDIIEYLQGRPVSSQFENLESSNIDILEKIKIDLEKTGSSLETQDKNQHIDSTYREKFYQEKERKENEQNKNNREVRRQCKQTKPITRFDDLESISSIT